MAGPRRRVRGIDARGSALPVCARAGFDRSPSYLTDSPQCSRFVSIQRYRRLGALVPDVVSPGGHARWNVEKVREPAEQVRDDD